MRYGLFAFFFVPGIFFPGLYASNTTNETTKWYSIGNRDGALAIPEAHCKALSLFINEIIRNSESEIVTELPVYRSSQYSIGIELVRNQHIIACEQYVCFRTKDGLHVYRKLDSKRSEFYYCNSAQAEHFLRIVSGCFTDVRGLCSALDHPFVENKIHALGYLERLGSEAGFAIPLIRPLLISRDHAVCISAVRAMHRIKPTEVDVFQILSRESKGTISCKCLVASAIMDLRLDSSNFRTLLYTLLRDPDRSVRRISAEAISNLGNQPPEVIPELIHTIQNSFDDVVNEYLVCSFGKIVPSTKEGISFLCDCLHDMRNYSIRRGSVAALRELQKDATPAISRLYEFAIDPENQYFVRIWAFEAIRQANADDPKLVTTLVLFLKEDEDPIFRRRIIEELGKLGGRARRALPPLRILLQSKELGASEPDIRILHSTIRKIEQ